MSLIVSSNGQDAVLAGDVAHSPCQFARLDWSSVVDFDGEQASRTRRELAWKFADTSTLIFGGHSRSGQACERRRCVQNDLTTQRAEERGTFPDPVDLALVIPPADRG